jgi:hypothetical protein
MKHILFTLLIFLSFQAFSQSENGQYFNEKIAAEVYSQIDSLYKLKCCVDFEKKSAYQISFTYETETTCFDGFFNLDEYYFLTFNDEYLEFLGKDISKYYNRYYSENKRKSFTKSCWTMDKKIIIEDNMSNGDGMVCATTYLKITFYFQ